MNTTLLPIDINYFSSPVKSFTRLTPVPRPSEDDSELADSQFFRIQEDKPIRSPFKSPLPARHIPILKVDNTNLPASRLRRIARELSENEYDSQTVFRSCRGLTKGTRRFDEAYIDARIRSFAKCQRISADLYLSEQFRIVNPTPEPAHTDVKKPQPPTSHPMAVIYLGHLMAHFSIWVIALLGAQIWCSWKIAGLADEYFQGGRLLYLGITLFIMLTLDTGVWFRRRGNLSDAFHAPGIILFLIALIPAFLLYLRGVLQFSQ